VSQDSPVIIIDKPIRVGEGRGAQVLLTNDGLVAKFYDPLFYKFHDSWFPGDKVNITVSADKDYVIEVAAYSAPCTTNFQGFTMPKYYGSWTVSVPVTVDGEQHDREVRFILLEHAVGTCMLDIKPDDLAQEERDNIMFKLIEADIDLHFAGLRHDDLEPGNVILSLPDVASCNVVSTSNITPYVGPDLRVCIIDFADSALSEIVIGKLPRREYCNPLFHWPGADLWSDWG
jgi:serine/threonine protein kinase